MKRLGCMILWLVLLMLPVMAAEHTVVETDMGTVALHYGFETKTLEQVLNQFCEEEGLTEQNFSLSCYVTGTGELVSIHGDVFRVAASTYKLPLNMVYYDMERRGEISPESYIDGYYLPNMHYETIVNSNNDMAISMLYHLGSFWQYREIMTQFYEQEYPSEYYAGNNINSDYMLAVLWKLYNAPEDYEELLEHMKIAARGQYFQLYQGNYEIAHKYGYYEGAINDVGILYTPEPVLVAAYTQNVSYAEDKLGRIAELLTEYSLYHTEKKAREEQERQAEQERLAALAAEEEARQQAEAQAALEEEAQTETEPEPETPEPVEAPIEEPMEPEEPEPEARRTLMPVALGAGGLLLGVILVFICIRKRKGQFHGAV